MMKRWSFDVRSGGPSQAAPLERENEQAWKGSGETAGMVSVLAEPPRRSCGRSMRAMETTSAASLNAGEGEGEELSSALVGLPQWDQP